MPTYACNGREDLAARAEAGDAEAQNALGLAYVQKIDAEAQQAAEDWFRRSAEQGFARAQHNLGVLYLRRGRTQEALEWFRQAASSSYLPAIHALATMLEDAGELERARAVFEIAARRGHAESQDALSRIYFERETNADYEQALYWAERAAAHGIPSAQTRLGTMYHEGLATVRDPERAAACFLAAAKQGHPGAQLMIGGALHLGIGIGVNKVEAAMWLIRSAEQGNDLALAYLKHQLLPELTEGELARAMAEAREPVDSSGIDGHETGRP